MHNKTILVNIMQNNYNFFILILDTWVDMQHGPSNCASTAWGDGALWSSTQLGQTAAWRLKCDGSSAQPYRYQSSSGKFNDNSATNWRSVVCMQT